MIKLWPWAFLGRFCEILSIFAETPKEDRQAKNLAWHQKRYHRKYDGKFVKRVKPLPAAEETPKAQKKKKKKVGASAQDKRETYFD